MNKATIILHSGSLDKLMSALIIGNGFLSMGTQVTLYFTFWGLNRLKKNKLSKAPLSQMNFLGLGSLLIHKKMKSLNVASPQRLMADFRELGGKIIACQMTMDLMGISQNKLDTSLIDQFGTVGMYIKETQNSQHTLFI